MSKLLLLMKPRYLVLALILAAITLGLIARNAGAYHTCVAVDEANSVSSAGSLDVRITRSLGQALRTNAAGMLVGVEVAPLQGTTTPSTEIQLDVMDSGGSVMGTVGAPAEYPPGGAGAPPANLQSGVVGPGFFDTSSLGIEFVQGHLFRIGVRHTTFGECEIATSTCVQGLIGGACSVDSECEPAIHLGVSSDAYPHGSLTDNGTLVLSADLAFKTFIETSPPVDQQNLISIGNGAGTFHDTSGQSFTVGTSGQLIGIELEALRGSLPIDSTVELALLDYATRQPLAAVVLPVVGFPIFTTYPSSLASCDIGPGFFEFLPQDEIYVSEGQQLVFEVRHIEDLGRCDTQTGLCIGGLIGFSCATSEQCAPDFRLGLSNDEYAGGTYEYGGTVDSSSDLAFKIFIVAHPPPAVPFGRWVSLIFILILCALGMYFAWPQPVHSPDS